MSNVNGLSYVTSPLSEYLGSHIYQMLGYEAHETLLGICFDGRRNKVVCACKDFISDPAEQTLIPYTALRNDTNAQLMAKRDSSSFSASNINEPARKALLQRNVLIRYEQILEQAYFSLA